MLRFTPWNLDQIFLMPVSRDFAQTVKTHERSTWEVQDYWVPGPKTHTFLFWVCHHHLWHKMCFRLGTSNLDSASSDQIMGGLILIWFLIKAQFILKNNIWTGWMDFRMLQRHLVSLFYFLNKEAQKCSGFCICWLGNVTELLCITSLWKIFLMTKAIQISHLASSWSALLPDLHGLRVFLSPYRQRDWPGAVRVCSKLNLHYARERRWRREAN